MILCAKPSRHGIVSLMARHLRIQFPRAGYHGTFRGNGRTSIFGDDELLFRVIRADPDAHTRVLGGAQPATGAGTLKVSNGAVVTEITNISGTFQFGSSTIPYVIDSLRNQGVQVSPTAARPFIHYSD